MTIADGCRVAIRFSQPLIGNITGMDPPLGSKIIPVDLLAASITTLNTYSTSYPISNLVDGNTGTYWRGTTAVNWIQIKLPKAKNVVKLRIYLGSYYVQTFKFSGSNDGSTWTQLGEERAAASSTTAQWYEYEIENENSYLYYRIDTLTAYSTSRIYVYELELYEKVWTGNEAKFAVSFDEYNHTPEGTLFRATRDVARIERYTSLDRRLSLTGVVCNGTEYVGGRIILATAEEETDE